MKSTAFIFGRTPHLSFLELVSLYPSAGMLTPHVALVKQEVDVQEAIRVLGGTVKIAEVVTKVPVYNEEQLLPILVREARDGHITFGLSAYGKAHLSSKLPAILKKMLAGQGLTARYVESEHDGVLSSVVVSKQHIVEIVIIAQDSGITLGITRAVQDFEDWNRRDFGRPAADPKAGMLPPKVARMIVNIALSGHDAGHHPMILDPFCGVGTVLAEAQLRGANVIGSDISEMAVASTKKNLDWLRQHYPETVPLYANLFVADATHLVSHIAPQSVDAIVTEPFMGSAIDAKDVKRLTPDRVKNILKGLEKLYIGSLREWMTLLKPKARVVMAMPVYVTTRAVTRVKNVVDRGMGLGYTLLTGPIEYSRPQAVVKREFYVFEKKH